MTCWKDLISCCRKKHGETKGEHQRGGTVVSFMAALRTPPVVDEEPGVILDEPPLRRRGHVAWVDGLGSESKSSDVKSSDSKRNV